MYPKNMINEDTWKDLQDKIKPKELAAFCISLGGIGVEVIKDINNYTTIEFCDDDEYAIWDFRNSKVVGLFCEFGVVAEMESFVIYGLKPINEAYLLGK